jgi:DNA repair protein RadC
MNTSMKIKNMQEGERPREKIWSNGVAALSEAELLALLIGSGYQEKSAIDLARDILKEHGPLLHQLSKLGIQEWIQIKGIGHGKAALLSACFEIGRRRKLESPAKVHRIQCSKDAFESLMPILGDLRYEEFWVMLLNRAHQIIALKKISEGGLSSTSVDPKRIFNTALQHHAHSIILAHNHPSGNLSPSLEDKRITDKLQKVGVELELSVIDHLIISGNVYFSFADEGLM